MKIWNAQILCPQNTTDSIWSTNPVERSPVGICIFFWCVIASFQLHRNEWLDWYLQPWNKYLPIILTRIDGMSYTQHDYILLNGSLAFLPLPAVISSGSKPKETILTQLICMTSLNVRGFYCWEDCHAIQLACGWWGSEHMPEENE